MIKRTFQFAVFFVIGLAFVSFLPLYLERTMTRAQVMGDGGDVISYGWKIRTLYGFLSSYEYSRPEENFFFWLAVNFGLACFYAFILALVTVLLAYLSRRKRIS